MKTSFIYKNIMVYRMVMNFLYAMKYKQRFYDIANQLNDTDKTVLELCFGDTILAGECTKRHLLWTGYDINEYFVKNAVNEGFNAVRVDIAKLDILPRVSVCVMCGSLYHFMGEIESMLRKMLNAAPKVIISEPVENLSSRKGLIGKISKILTNAGKGHENYRFDKTSIIEMLNKYSESLHFTYAVVHTNRDILVVIHGSRN